MLTKISQQIVALKKEALKHKQKGNIEHAKVALKKAIKCEK